MRPLPRSTLCASTKNCLFPRAQQRLALTQSALHRWCFCGLSRAAWVCCAAWSLVTRNAFFRWMPGSSPGMTRRGQRSLALPARSAWGRAQDHGDLHRLAIAPGVEIDRRAGGDRRDNPSEIARTHQRGAVDRGEHVTCLDVRRGGGAIRFRPLEDGAVRFRHAQALREGRGHRTDLDADPPADIVAVLLRLNHARAARVGTDEQSHPAGEGGESRDRGNDYVPGTRRHCCISLRRASNDALAASALRRQEGTLASMNRSTTARLGYDGWTARQG